MLQLGRKIEFPKKGQKNIKLFLPSDTLDFEKKCIEKAQKESNTFLVEGLLGIFSHLYKSQ